MTATAEKPRVIIAVPPILLNRDQAGKYLCASEDFLRINAKRHDLYKPSIPHKGQGAACKYHIEHLNIIAKHLMSPETYTEDAALLVWRRMLANDIQGDLDGAKMPVKKGNAR